MDNYELTFCKLCFSVITDGNSQLIQDDIKEALDMLLLKLNQDKNHKPVMCNACTQKVFAAFNFKKTCMNTENNILSHINSENVIPVDLREIFVKLRGKEYLRSMLEDERICRLCMQSITCGFTSIGEIETDMVLKCIPEINFNFTIDPVICSLCLDSLNTHSSFLQSCLDVDTTEGAPSYIKSEDIEIKTEEYDEYGDTSPVHSDELVDDKNMDIDTPDPHVFNQKTYTCDICFFKTRFKSNLTTHQLKHKDCTEVRIYKCDACDYASKHKGNLTRHQLKHKNISEVRLYKCDACDFKTKHNSNLIRHQLKHKDFSEVPVYKCDTCDYKTKVKGNMIAHQLKHNDSPEVQVYRCDNCDFKTKHRPRLLCHQLKHKDLSEVLVYKCDACDFKTKYKHSLQGHQLRHKNISEIQMYKCHTCGFNTKYKSNFIKHQLTHKNVSEVGMYKCDESVTFQT